VMLGQDLPITRPLQMSQFISPIFPNAGGLLSLSMRRMGHPKCTSHHPRLFSGISPPSITMLLFSPRTRCTKARRAWGGREPGPEILLSVLLQDSGSPSHTAAKPFLPCFTWGTFPELGCGASRGTWAAVGRGEPAPTLPCASQEKWCLQKAKSGTEGSPLHYAPLLYVDSLSSTHLWGHPTTFRFPCAGFPLAVGAAVGGAPALVRH